MYNATHIFAFIFLKQADRTNSARAFTVSLAMPGSVLLKQDTLELKSLLASRLARAAAIFRADEVVVFDEEASCLANGAVPAASST